MTDPRDVTRREFDEVIRRATELAEAEGDRDALPARDGGEGRLPESELIRIAAEVGLAESHVRRALAEVRGGTVPAAPAVPGPLDALLGPERIRLSRVVPGRPRELAAQIDLFLDSYARIAGSGVRGKIRTRRLEALEADRTLVELEVDPGTREDALAFAATGSVLGAAFGFFTFVGMYDVVGWLGAALAPMVAGSIGIGATLWGRRHHRRGLDGVRDEVEGILDRLEARHYHGAAKDALLIGQGDGPND